MALLAAELFLPNRMMHFFHQALEETIGHAAAALIGQSPGAQGSSSAVENLASVPDDLEKAVSFDRFSALCASIEREYGAAGARTILQRCGRAALCGTLRSTAAMVGLDSPRFRMRAGAASIAEGLTSVARLLAILSDMQCAVQTVPQGYRIRVSTCPECRGRGGERLCHSVGGMWRGALDWFGVDPAIPVRELECIAGGNAGCDFSITGAF
jgi:predicted hydrocarbon binding protein